MHTACREVGKETDALRDDDEDDEQDEEVVVEGEDEAASTGWTAGAEPVVSASIRVSAGCGCWAVFPLVVGATSAADLDGESAGLRAHVVGGAK